MSYTIEAPGTSRVRVVIDSVSVTTVGSSFLVASAGLVTFGQDRVDLADRLRHALFHAHRQHLLHRRLVGKLAGDRHARPPAADCGDGDALDAGWEVGVRIALLVSEAVAHNDRSRWIDLQDVPEAARCVPFRSGHEVRHSGAR